MDQPTQPRPTPLAHYLAQRRSEREHIRPPRRDQLRQLAGLLQTARASDDVARAVFVCTHNARRSHFAMVWFNIAVQQAGLTGHYAYSGGTEATAVNPRAIAALRRAGLLVEALTPHDANCVYLVRTQPDAPPVVCFSKPFTSPPNPAGGFVAVMVCHDADNACPAVPDAAARMALPYEDPRVADNTPDEQHAYDQSCSQIAREMLFLADQLRADPPQC